MGSIGGFPIGQPAFNNPGRVTPNSGLNDPQFDQAVSKALDAAFGADPATRRVMPGPIAHLMDLLQGDFNRSGSPGLGSLFPTGSGNPTTPFGGNIPPLLRGILPGGQGAGSGGLGGPGNLGGLGGPGGLGAPGGASLSAAVPTGNNPFGGTNVTQQQQNITNVNVINVNGGADGQPGQGGGGLADQNRMADNKLMGMLFSVMAMMMTMMESLFRGLMPQGSRG